MSARTSRALVCLAAGAWGVWVCAHAYTRPAAWHAALIDRPIEGFTFWQVALARVLWAAAGALVVGGAAWQLGALLTGKAAALFNGPAERAQFTLAIGSALLMSVFVASASLGLYRPLVLLTVLAACIASRPRVLVTDAIDGARHVRRWLATAFSPSMDAIFLWYLCAAAVFAGIAALAPEVEYDALWYHLWLPTKWLSAGRLIDIPEEYISLYPGGWEVLNGAAMTIGGPVSARLLHFAAAWLTVGAAMLLGRAVVPGVSKWTIAALCICVPTVLWEASTAYVDLALAWFTTLATVAIFRYHESRDRRWLLCAGVVAGGALCVKHLGLVALAAQATMLVTAQWRASGLRIAARSCAILVAAALVLASPWYARAYAASGNPVFPQMYDLFGATPPSRWSSSTERALAGFQSRFGVGGSAAALAALPWQLSIRPARFGGSLGPLFLIFVPFAPWWRPGGRMLRALAAGSAIYVAVWASPLGSQQLRFLLPVVPCGALLAAAGVRELTESLGLFNRRLALVPTAAVAALLLFNLPPFIEWHETERRGWNGWLTHVLRAAPFAVVVGAESEEAYLSRSVPTYRAWQAIDARTEAGSRVLTFSSGDHLYSHRPRIWSDATVAYEATWGATEGHEGQMFNALGRLGISYVLFVRGRSDETVGAHLAIRSAKARACCLVPFYSDERAEVFRLVYPEESARWSARRSVP